MEQRSLNCSVLCDVTVQRCSVLIVLNFYRLYRPSRWDSLKFIHNLNKHNTNSLSNSSSRTRPKSSTVHRPRVSSQRPSWIIVVLGNDMTLTLTMELKSKCCYYVTEWGILMCRKGYQTILHVLTWYCGLLGLAVSYCMCMWREAKVLLYFVNIES